MVTIDKLINNIELIHYNIDMEINSSTFWREVDLPENSKDGNKWRGEVEFDIIYNNTSLFHNT